MSLLGGRPSALIPRLEVVIAGVFVSLRGLIVFDPSKPDARLFSRGVSQSCANLRRKELSPECLPKQRDEHGQERAHSSSELHPPPGPELLRLVQLWASRMAERKVA